MSKTYNARKARGVCPVCEGAPAPNRVHCKNCLMDMRRRADPTLGTTVPKVRNSRDWLKPYARKDSTWIEELR